MQNLDQIHKSKNFSKFPDEALSPKSLSESKTSTIYGEDTYDSDNSSTFDPNTFKKKNIDDNYGPIYSIAGQNSIIPEVAATIPITDDPSLPVSTLRVYIISTVLIVLSSFCAQFYLFRFNSVNLDTTVHIVLAYILGILMQKIPFKFLNQGKFNQKEHTLIIIICSNAVNINYGILQLIIQRLFLGPNQDPKVPDPEGLNIGYILSILFLSFSNILGFGLAGFFEKFLVHPASMWFPQNLLVANLLNTFHAPITRTITRLRLGVFIGVFILASIYEFLPQLFTPVLQSISLLCLLAGGTSGTVRDIFNLGDGFTGQLGSMAGGGLFSLSLDWQALSRLQPLVTPLWSQMNVIFSNIALSWIITPILLSFNIWNSKSYPVFSPRIFNTNGAAQVRLDSEHQQLRLSLNRALGYGCKFAAITSLLVHFILFYSSNIVKIFKSQNDQLRNSDVHTKLMGKYSKIPSYWYLSIFIVSLISSVFITGSNKLAFQSELWFIPLALFITALFALPAGILKATSNQTFGLNIFAQYIMGILRPGKIMANTTFKIYGTNTLFQLLSYTSNMKLAYYMKVPPRSVFFGMLYGTTLSCIVSYTTFDQLIKTNDNIWKSAHGEPVNDSQWTSFRVITIASAAQIWGGISPAKFFGNDYPYKDLIHFWYIGALLPVLFYYLARKFPSKGFQYVNWPIIFSSATLTATGYANSFFSAGIVAVLSQYYARNYRRRWYDRYNYIVSASLDLSVAFVAVIISWFLTDFKDDPKYHYFLNPDPKMFGNDYCGAVV